VTSALDRVQAAPTAFNKADVEMAKMLGLNPADPRSRAAVAIAEAYGLDPVMKHVIVIPNKGPYITRDGLLHVAHRSGQFDGEVVDMEPVLTEDGMWIARVSVYRRDMKHPFSFPGRYPAKGKNSEYGPEMALVRAECHSLRRAFSVTGIPSYEEQASASIYVQHEDIPAHDPDTAELVDTPGEQA
jgi:hypothetical protein